MKRQGVRWRRFFQIVGLAALIGLVCPLAGGEEVNDEGWPVPDLRGLDPYQITVQRVDGVEKMIERFHTPMGGHVARVSGNGKVYAYAVDKDQEPPMDYLLLDPDGKGRFTLKLGPHDSYKIPEWVSQ